jgi:TolB-like protein/Flp pilus assembly protein TadD
VANLSEELKRRKVFKVGGAYLVVAWLAIQGASIGFPAFDAPPWVLRVFILVALIGFQVAVVMAWVFESTPEGIAFDPVRKGTKRVVLVAVVLCALALGWYFKGQPAFRATDTSASVGAAVSRDDDKDGKSRLTAAPTISDQSIAVLPFENLSADPDNAFFATGIQDEILTSLAKVGGLKVISRTSTIKYGAKPENLQQIGKELGVANILEGSVQRSGDTVRVNVQLIDARTDQHRWAETYDRPLANVFKVQSEVAETIAGELNTKLSSAEQAALAKPPTTNARAYEHYLRGLALFLETSSYSKETSYATIREFEAAVKEDPNFTLAWAYLTVQDTWYYFTGFAPTKQQLDKARDALAHAEALDPQLKEVRAARASYLYYGLQDFKGALAITRKLNAEFPNDARAWYYTGLLSRRLGDFDGAIAAFEQCRRLGPNDYSCIGELSVVLWTIQRYPEALRVIESAEALQPGDPAMLALKLHSLWATQGLPAGARMLAALKVDNAGITGLRAQQAEYERDDTRAEALYRKALADYRSDEFSPAVFAGYVPLTLEWRLRLAALHQRHGDAAAAATLYGAIVAEADKQLHAAVNPYVQAAWHAARGIALAGLGRKAEAVAEGERAIAIIPLGKDAFEGPYWPVYLARIHAMNGEAGPALALLRKNVDARMGIDPPGILRLDPLWDPIRKDPGFVALLARQ